MDTIKANRWARADTSFEYIKVSGPCWGTDGKDSIVILPLPQRSEQMPIKLSLSWNCLGWFSHAENGMATYFLGFNSLAEEGASLLSWVRKSKYLWKNSLLDMFLFQLKILGSLAAGKETCLYNLFLCIVRNHHVWTLFFISFRQIPFCQYFLISFFLLLLCVLMLQTLLLSFFELNDFCSSTFPRHRHLRRNNWSFVILPISILSTQRQYDLTF